ncbi:MAG: hypothetical protein ABIJ34_03110 [archaeon]
MSQPFSEEPLEDILKYSKSKSRKIPDFAQHESIFFVALLILFISGFLYARLNITGNVVIEDDISNIAVNQEITNSTTLSFAVAGNITGLRVTGEFIGNGSAKIYLWERLVVDSKDLSFFETNKITGMVIQDGQVADMLEPESPVDMVMEIINESGNDSEPIVHETDGDEIAVDPTQLNIGLNEGATENGSYEMNTTAEPEQVYENYTIDDNVSVDGATTGIQTSNTSQQTDYEAKDLHNFSSEAEDDLEVPLDNYLENPKRIAFAQYCSDTCNFAAIPGEFILRIELDNMVLNLTSITLILGNNENYQFNNAEGINNTANIPGNMENQTLQPNISVNSSDGEFYFSWNISFQTNNLSMNNTLNITLNSTLMNISTTNTTYNLSINDTFNISLNMTFNLLINGTYLNETSANITLNLSTLNMSDPLYEFELFNQSMAIKGFIVSEYIQEENMLSISGAYENILLSADNLTKAYIGRPKRNDGRFFSQIEIRNYTFAKISYPMGNSLYECIQYESGICKRWAKSELEMAKDMGQHSYELSKDGVYAITSSEKVRKQFIPTGSLNLNTNCERCDTSAHCDSIGFNPVINQGDWNYSAIGQMDFDILNIDDTIVSAEICAYTKGRYTKNYTINYLRDSETAYCGPINQTQMISNAVTYKIIDQDIGWVCMPALDILRFNLGKKYSNMFVDWAGEDLNGNKGPFNMYVGIRDLSYCDNDNPGGAEDCRPYLKIEYRP